MTDPRLKELYDLFVEDLMRTLRDPECKASDRNVIRQFLKDNDITSIPTDQNALGKLIAELPFHYKEFDYDAST